jgi:hypothetical protein
MIKLVDILKEISLEEKVIQVPQEVLDKSKSLYDYVNKVKDKVIKKGAISGNNPYVDPKLKDYFKLKDLTGNDISVSIGFFNDPEDDGEANMAVGTDTLSINLAKLSNYDYHHFEDNIEHELVHAMDPKLRNTRVHFGDEKGKGGVEKKGIIPAGSDEQASYTKYIKSPWEFDAFTAPLVNKISKSINKTGENKKQYRQLLINLFSDLRTQDFNELAASDKYAPLAWLFTKKEWDEKNWNAAYDEYVTELNKISRWITKPTLYKRFLQRVAAAI